MLKIIFVHMYRVMHDFKYKDISECKYKAKIRVTGDMEWHLDWKKGSPLSSLQIKLLDGHIYNVTQFKFKI